MRTYISGKITGLDITVAKNNFKEAEESLKQIDLIPVNPMEIVPENKDFKWEDYMLADIKELFNCEAIFMLSNWKDSKGARIERAIALEMEINIFYQ